jgi:hypothetical protein
MVVSGAACPPVDSIVAMMAAPMKAAGAFAMTDTSSRVLDPRSMVSAAFRSAKDCLPG